MAMAMAMVTTVMMRMLSYLLSTMKQRKERQKKGKQRKGIGDENDLV